MKLTENQLELIRKASRVEGPFELCDSDPSRSFVYDRCYGFFKVGYASHSHLMALLLAFHLGFDNVKELEASRGWKWPFEMSDNFLKTLPGTCYLSSCGIVPECAYKYSLTPSEKRFFGDVEYIFENEHVA